MSKAKTNIGGKMRSSEVFAWLHQAACNELNTIQEQGAAYFNQADFQLARATAERAEKLKELVTSLENLRNKWESIIPEVIPEPEPKFQSVLHSVVRTQNQRTSPGERTLQSEFRVPILQALVEMGGRGRTRRIVDRVGELMEDILNEVDQEFLPGGGDIRWRNAAQWERFVMVEIGLLSSSMPNGTWEITEEGRKYLVENS
jgi:restriction system protein